jgi:hypothetical protein
MAKSKKSARATGSVLGATAAAAAAVGIGLGAAPAGAQPDEQFTPSLPPSPFQAHTKAPETLFTRLPDVFRPTDPYRVVSGNVDRFNKRFEAGVIGPDGGVTTGDTSSVNGDGSSG